MNLDFILAPVGQKDTEKFELDHIFHSAGICNLPNSGLSRLLLGPIDAHDDDLYIGTDVYNRFCPLANAGRIGRTKSSRDLHKSASNLLRLSTESLGKRIMIKFFSPISLRLALFARML